MLEKFGQKDVATLMSAVAAVVETDHEFPIENFQKTFFSCDR
jgi:hypothetical protein